jgi:pimeloyl-ACP methyl ester carboxylesterase
VTHADVYYRSSDGLRLYARDYAGPRDDSPAILCLPGLTRNSKDFAELAEHLRSRYRVVCPDQRGRGRSERDQDSAHYRPDTYVRDMWTLIDLLQLPRIRIIGTSLGGMMAVMMAVQAPPRIDRIAINDIGPELDPQGIARIASYVGKSAPVATWNDAARQSREINAVAFPDFNDADWMAMARKVYIQEGTAPVLDYDPLIARGLAPGAPAPNLWPLFEALGQTPVLALRGELSDLLSEHTFDEMSRRLPHVTRVVIPRRGHAPALNEPEAIAAIDQFFSAG